jgi:hypothetical protein
MEHISPSSRCEKVLTNTFDAQERMDMKGLLLLLCLVTLLVGCNTTEPPIPADPVGKKFQVAQNSIESLGGFILAHPEHPMLCGGAQMRIGYLLEHAGKEKLPEAISAYKKAIREYGTVRDINAAAAPLNAPILVANTARLKVAVCYTKMGDKDEARKWYEAITDERLKGANRRHFVNQQDTTTIEHPAGDRLKAPPEE